MSRHPLHAARRVAAVHPSRHAGASFRLSSMARIVRLAFSGSVLALAVCQADALAQAAVAQAPLQADATRRYDIPAGPLSVVLARFANESGVLVAGAGEQAQGKHSPGVSGIFGVQAALDALLAGTGLAAVPASGGAYVLRQLPASKIEATTLSAISVSGKAIGSLPTGAAQAANTATKTDTPLIETPQSVNVIMREQMTAQAAESLDQAVAYSPGIYALEGGADRRTLLGFTMRGFNVTGASPLYLNGTRLPVNSYNAPPDPYSYERVELLKGPASVLYGSATPGGVINLVSKRPTTEPLREIEAQLGSWQRRQVAADFGGPLTRDASIRYRLTGLLRNSNTMVKEVPDDRGLLNAAIDWDISSTATLTLLAGYNRSHSMTGSFATPRSGTLTPNPFGPVPRTLFTGEPGFDKFKTKGVNAGYLFSYRIDDSWTFRQNFLFFDYEVDNAYSNIGARTSTPSPVPIDTLARGASTRFDTNSGYIFDTQLQGKLTHGRFAHTVLFGVDWNDSEWTRAQRSGSQQPLDLLNPTYGVSDITLNPASYQYRDTRQLGFYIQDHIKFHDRWVVLLGGRYDSTNDQERAISAAGASTTAQVDSSAFSPRFGLMHLFENGLAPYYSFTTSFLPQAGSDFYENAFKPTRGRQHEIGIKFEPRDKDISINASAYEIVQRNVLTPDPVHSNHAIQTGEVTSRGFELEMRARLSKRLDLIGAFSTTDAQVTQSNRPGEVGNRPASVPRHMASLWVDYRLESVPGFGVSAGIRRIGKRADLNGAEILSPFTIYDAALRYEWNKWQFALNIKNVTDKHYISSCTFQCWNGEARSVVLTGRYRW